MFRTSRGLRMQVGKSGPRRSAIVLATDGEGRVLLVRVRGGPFRGSWLLPGGALEPGEAPEDAARRELLEETGLTATGLREIGRYDVVGETPEPFHFLVHLFTGAVRGEARPGSDGESVAWTEVEADALHPVALRELIDGGVVRMDVGEAERRCAAIGVRMSVAPRGSV